MKISEAQKTTISEWVGEGLKLSDIQLRIHQTFGINLTYMDVRFLVDDLDLQLKDQPKPVDHDLRNAPPLPDASDYEESFPEAELDGVTVSLHRLYKPGAVFSGDVVFSDGEKAEWTLDQLGRLALKPVTEAYRPSKEDLQDFQIKLGKLIQDKGY